MTTLSKLQTVIKKTSPHGKVAQKITGNPLLFHSVRPFKPLWTHLKVIL